MKLRRRLPGFHPIWAMTRRLRRGSVQSTAYARVLAISHGAKGATPWRTSRHRSMALRKWVNPSATGVDPGRRRYPTPRRRSARRGARRRGRWRRAPGTANGSRLLIGADPVELLEEQAASRVPELVPIRYGRMLVSPFTFFRGAAYPMAADLAGAPRTGLDVQLCGDAHLSNFGAFAGARSAACVQHQRLRRDAAGPVRVGREAAGGQLRRRRPGSRLRRQASGGRSTGP